MKTMMKGAILATAVAGLFLSATTTVAGDKKDAETVKCQGVNECKGKGACGSDTHGCAGHNECKGKGWIKLSKEECEKKGGTVVGEKKKKG